MTTVVPLHDTSPDRAGPVDGRTLRAQRTRDAVVEALLVLQEEGDLSPTAQRVAARAGVALRTVYGHFSDMEALWLEAGRRELLKITDIADIPPADRPFAERVDRFTSSRARVLEALLPVMRATRLRRPFSEQLQRNWRLYVQVGDDSVRTTFGPELAAAGDRAGELLDGLYLLLGASAWDSLRDDRGLQPPDAERVVRQGVLALLRAYTGTHTETDTDTARPSSEGPR